MRLVINSIDSLIQNLSNTEFKSPQVASNEKADLHNKLLGNAQSAIDELQKNIKPGVVYKLAPQAQNKVVLNIDNLIKAIKDLGIITPEDIAEEEQLVERNPPSPDKA